MPTLVWIILLLLLVGVLPLYPYSRCWTYFPSGAVGLLMLVVILLAVFRGGGI